MCRDRTTDVSGTDRTEVARSERFELPTLGIEIRCSIQLSYERLSLRDGLAPQLPWLFVGSDCSGCETSPHADQFAFRRLLFNTVGRDPAQIASTDHPA